MKTYHTIIFVLVTFAAFSNLFADFNEAKLKKACQAYEQSLNCENLGVVESAIIGIMKLKTFYPDHDYKCLIKLLEKLSFDGPTNVVRYKAYIAANYLKHPERFTWIKCESYEKLTQFFAEYESKLEQQLEKINQTLVASADNE